VNFSHHSVEPLQHYTFYAVKKLLTHTERQFSIAVNGFIFCSYELSHQSTHSTLDIQKSNFRLIARNIFTAQ